MRVPTNGEQSWAQMPKPTRPQFPAIKVGEAIAKRPTLYNVGPWFIPSAKVKFDAEAIADGTMVFSGRRV